MPTPRILGLSASLRNARSKAGAHRLGDEIAALSSRDELQAYLDEQANIHLGQFMEAGRKDGKPFDELYRNLQRSGGLKGLSNSEIALAAALWGARDKGAEISHIPLPDHFPASGEPQNLDELKAALRAADGIIVSTPVYFGDRGSLVQEFVEMIRADDELRADLEGKLYAGVSVGAKRNGGQETTLIYAMMDMLTLGFLAVGNDSATTSQYGGTGHAGDVGTMPKDKYGLDTAIGTGRRIASVAALLKVADEGALTDRPKMDFWVLQDRDGELGDRMAPFAKAIEAEAETRFLSLVDKTIRPCIACDICPTHVGPDGEYRCIIRRREDGVVDAHAELLKADVLVPALYSPVDRKGLVSVYQQFMERTRYLRRGDYVFTDHLVLPLVVTEVGSKEFLDLRMMTSFVRHHTVLVEPVVALVHEGKLLNPEEVSRGLERAARHGARLTVGRLAGASLGLEATHYQPVGYVLASAKDNETSTMTARERAVRERELHRLSEARRRLKTIDRAAGTAGGR